MGATNTVTVFGSSAAKPGDDDYNAAKRLGQLLANAGFAVATGGYGGLMEAVSHGADEAGGTVIGVTAPEVFPKRATANRFVREHIRAASLTERIHELVDVADASITLPGNIGTLTELMVAWNIAYVARFSDRPPDPVVTVGEQWKAIVGQLSGVLDADPSLVTCVDTVDEAAAEVVRRLGAKP